MFSSGRCGCARLFVAAQAGARCRPAVAVDRHEGAADGGGSSPRGDRAVHVELPSGKRGWRGRSPDVLAGVAEHPTRDRRSAGKHRLGVARGLPGDGVALRWGVGGCEHERRGERVDPIGQFDDEIGGGGPGRGAEGHLRLRDRAGRRAGAGAPGAASAKRNSGRRRRLRRDSSLLPSAAPARSPGIHRDRRRCRNPVPPTPPSMSTRRSRRLGRGCCSVRCCTRRSWPRRRSRKPAVEPRGAALSPGSRPGPQRWRGRCRSVSRDVPRRSAPSVQVARNHRVPLVPHPRVPDGVVRMDVVAAQTRHSGESRCSYRP